MSVQTIIQSAINNHISPGLSVGVVNKNGQLRTWQGGYQTYERKYRLTNKTIYDVASITKTLPTSSLALLLHQQHLLDWNEPLEKFFPHLARNFPGKPQVKHLLQHTMTYQQPALSLLKHLSAEDLKKQITSTSLRLPPGTNLEYCNTSSILLGWLIEMVSGQSLKQLAQQEIFTPLQMNSTSFGPLPANLISRTAPTENDSWRNKLLHGEVHDESAWKLQQSGRVVGSAGLFSSTNDILKFLHDLLQTNSQLFNTSSKKWWQKSQRLPTGETVTWGWEWNPHWAGQYTSTKAIGKSGFTGCSLFLDWEKEVGIVILSNAIYPHRPRNRQPLNDFRQEIHNRILQIVNTGTLS